MLVIIFMVRTFFIKIFSVRIIFNNYEKKVIVSLNRKHTKGSFS